MIAAVAANSKTRPPPPPLPQPRTLEIPGIATIQYIDVQPPHYDPATTPTIVLIHGSPGSYKDFRYIVPLLQPYARVVTLTLPGFDGSIVTDAANRFEHVTAHSTARIAFDALAQICDGAQHVFFVGHSFGGHTAINVAALNLKQARLQLKGLALLSSAGARPQGTSRPLSMNTVALLIRSRVPLVSRIGQSLAHTMFTTAGLKDDASTGHFASGMVRCMTTDYDRVGRQCRAISHLPALVAWTRDDHLIEEDIFVEMSALLGRGPRLTFDTGSHYLQRTKASVLGPAIVRWASDIVAAAAAGGSGRSDSSNINSSSSGDDEAGSEQHVPATTHLFTAHSKL